MYSYLIILVTHVNNYDELKNSKTPQRLRKSKKCSRGKKTNEYEGGNEKNSHSNYEFLFLKFSRFLDKFHEKVEMN